MGLTVKQVRAVDALLSHSSIAAAARAAGCSERSIRSWLDRDDFQGALLAAQANIRQAVTEALEYRALQAVRLLGDVMDDDTAPAATRVSAAKTVLGIVLRPDEPPPPTGPALPAEDDELAGKSEKELDAMLLELLDRTGDALPDPITEAIKAELKT